MFRLIKFLFTLLMLACLWYAATTYQLGTKTFWGHLKAIAGSDESKALVKEVKKKAVEVKGEVKEKGIDGKKIKEKVKGARERVEGAKEAVDNLTAEEREALRKLIKKKSAEKPAEEKPAAEAHPKTETE